MLPSKSSLDFVLGFLRPRLSMISSIKRAGASSFCMRLITFKNNA